jgi:hypothetical protein
VARMLRLAAQDDRGATISAPSRPLSAGLQDELLDPAVVAYALETAAAGLMTAPAVDVDARLATLRAREDDLGRSIEHLTDAIAAGGELAGLVTAVKQREHDRACVQDERTQLEAVRRNGPIDVGPLREDLARRVADWRTSAARSVAQGRQVLRKLLRGRVRMTPREDGTVELSGQADYGKLFSGILLPRQNREAVTRVSSDEGNLQQRWRPQRDSVPLARRGALRRATREDRWWTMTTEQREGGIVPKWT